MPFVVTLVLWTLLVWFNRLGNIWRDQELDTAGQLGRSALAASFIAGAVLVAFAAWRSAPGAAVTVAAVFGVWTVGVWVWRAIAILAGSESTGFKAVHTVLAVVSIALATAAYRELRARAARAGELPVPMQG